MQLNPVRGRKRRIIFQLLQTVPNRFMQLNPARGRKPYYHNWLQSY